MGWTMTKWDVHISVLTVPTPRRRCRLTQIFDLVTTLNLTRPDDLRDGMCPLRNTANYYILRFD